MDEQKDQTLKNGYSKEEIDEIKRYIISAESSLKEAKTALINLTGEDLNSSSEKTSVLDNLFKTKASPDGKIIEGVFNGENMVGPEGKIYPVPANYASKSKLIEGDQLKLTIAEDGTFIFKQIGPASRKSIIGTLSLSNNAYYVSAEGKNYNILYASVTYYKAKPGDRVTIIVPEKGVSDWACLENVIPKVSENEEPKENILEENSDAEDYLYSRKENVIPINNSNGEPRTTSSTGTNETTTSASQSTENMQPKPFESNPVEDSPGLTQNVTPQNIPIEPFADEAITSPQQTSELDI